LFCGMGVGYGDRCPTASAPHAPSCMSFASFMDSI